MKRTNNMKRYTKPEMEVINVLVDSVLLSNSLNEGDERDMFSKDGNNDFVFDDEEEEEESVGYAQTNNRNVWSRFHW